MSEKELSPARHEPTDVAEGYAWIATVLLVAAVFGLSLLVLLLYPRATTNLPLRLPLPPTPSPRLQANPSEDMAKFYRDEMLRLNGTGWIDKQRGIAHIPIADAMRLTAQQGIPDWPASADKGP